MLWVQVSGPAGIVFGEWLTSSLSTLNTTTEVRPLSKAPNPQLLPGRCSINGCPLLRVWIHSVCVYMFTTHCCVWVHLEGLSQRFSIPVLAPSRSAHFVCFSYRFRRLFYLNISALRSGQVEGPRTGIENRWVKCREQIPSIGHHAWPHVTSFPFLVIFFLKISSHCIRAFVQVWSSSHQCT